jgi:hypothetical protein
VHKKYIKAIILHLIEVIPVLGMLSEFFFFSLKFLPEKRKIMAILNSSSGVKQTAT